ncbi:MAG: hypothetical protein NVSMB55_00600 [Mycobacteriales bacterium]
MPTAAPERATTTTHRTEPRTASDPSAQVARLYPTDTPAGQRLLAQHSVQALRAAGRLADPGGYGLHATADCAVNGGSLVLVPMARLTDLDADLAVEDDLDPGVWHVLARNIQGRLIEDPSPGYGCPSVLLAVRRGIDPALAVGLVHLVMSDPYLRALIGGVL